MMIAYFKLFTDRHLLVLANPTPGEGELYVYWGELGRAELDLVLDFPGGSEAGTALVRVSCKQQHEPQTADAVMSHVNHPDLPGAVGSESNKSLCFVPSTCVL